MPEFKLHVTLTVDEENESDAFAAVEAELHRLVNDQGSTVYANITDATVKDPYA